MSKTSQRRARRRKGGADAERLPAVASATAEEPPKKGSIVRALLASPLAGSKLEPL